MKQTFLSQPSNILYPDPITLSSSHSPLSLLSLYSPSSASISFDEIPIKRAAFEECQKHPFIQWLNPSFQIDY
jgi:hypothetical protein